MKAEIENFRLELLKLPVEDARELSEMYSAICDYLKGQINEKDEEIEALEEQILDLKANSIFIPKEYQTVTTMSVLEDAFSNIGRIDMNKLKRIIN